MKAVFIPLIAMMFSTAAVAEEAASLLAQKLSLHQRFTAEFQQYTLSDGNRREEMSSGLIWIEHPDRIRWETTEPFPQLIIGDGNTLWIYDPDLEQATRRRLSPDYAFTPASVLGASQETLNQRFEISQIDTGANDALFELRPKETERAEFERLRLLFSQQVLSEILIQDTLGQRSLIMLDKVNFPSAIPSSRFTFELPAGTDLIEADAN